LALVIKKSATYSETTQSSLVSEFWVTLGFSLRVQFVGAELFFDEEWTWVLSFFLVDALHHFPATLHIYLTIKTSHKYLTKSYRYEIFLLIKLYNRLLFHYIGIINFLLLISFEKIII
jgi:hypothetical protein